jgi:hypothetical protein
VISAVGRVVQVLPRTMLSLSLLVVAAGVLSKAWNPAERRLPWKESDTHLGM